MPARYEKCSRIGDGENAIVFLGKSRDLGTEVAIKELRDTVRQNSQRRERIFQSAILWAKHPHAGLVRYLDIDRSQCWIIMQLMRPLLVNQQNPEDVRRHLIQALKALKKIHDAGYIHANIKPSNILDDGSGNAHLSDGWLLPAVNPGVLPAQTRSQKYLAPELVDDAFGTVGPSTDIYSLGFVMLESMVGDSFDSMFSGIDARDEAADLAWIRWHGSRDRVPSTRDAVPNCHDTVALVLDRMLLKDRLERYQSVQQALDDLAEGRGPAHSNRQAAVAVADQSEAEAGLGLGPEAIARRPESPVFLRIASGERAGQMIGVDSTEVVIGGDHECELFFDPAMHPRLQDVRVMIRREADAWRVRQVVGRGLILNQQVVTESAALKSGDLIRLTWLGPDIQFVIHNPDMTINALAAEWMPAGQGVESNAPVAPNHGADQPPLSVAPLAPSQAVNDAPEVFEKVVDAVDRPASAPAIEVASPTQGAKSNSSENWLRSLVDYKNWSKSQQNWVVGIIAVVIAMVLLWFIPSGGDDSAERPKEQSQSESN